MLFATSEKRISTASGSERDFRSKSFARATLATARGTDCFVFSLMESYLEVFSGGLPVASLIEERRGGGRLQK
jgi:hypothetical protein